ncbi:hypothetical protein ACJMK2_027736 [Sinanodonta woodiana]|uniref:Translin-associated factor X-interacting protein 1 N-terminal domain-containing protein n=1 Tax=Sinanodonta woodiana TaxID=1069815 RepID=A0ABD3X6E7_SINWO
MTAYKFTSLKQLRGILNNIETVQKQDIYTYAGGHLNEVHLHRPAVASFPSKTIWKSAKNKREKKEKKNEEQIAVQRDSFIHESAKETQMKDVLFDFSVGTTGSVPCASPRKRTTPRRPYKDFKKDSHPKSPSVASVKSLYTQLDDGVLIEELRPQEMMMPSPRLERPNFEEYSGKKVTPSEDEEYDIMEDITRNLEKDGLLTFRHTFLPSHTVGVTKTDQFHKMKQFESTVLRTQDSEEQKVLSGIKAVEHIERRLQEELNSMQFTGVGPNFHKLQIYSNSFEDLIDDTPTFGYILKCIKAEYDNYITKLLDSQTQKHSQLLREQVEQMSTRGATRPHELHNIKELVHKLEEEAKRYLEINQSLRDEVKAEEEWLQNAPEPEPGPSHVVASVYVDETPVELEDEIQHAKALILEKLDALNELRTRLREQFVPLTVCTHLEQCIKETEVEVQKLLKQNEYFKNSNTEMENELKDAVQDADTSERDARRIWKKVNSSKGLPVVNLDGEESQNQDSDDEDDDENKWNWYIS